MTTCKLANILLESNPRSIAYPSLYCRADAPVHYDRAAQCWQLEGPGLFDFTTYFNALSIAKWRAYTVVSTASLHLELKGAAARIIPTAADALARDPRFAEEPIAVIEASETWQTVDVQLPVSDSDVLIAFAIEADGPVYIQNSYYSSEVAQENIRPVELALASTTFKKEDFITGNIALLKEHILTSDEAIAKHFHVYVIDNGRTLDAAALSDEHVKVLPNDNVGGSGGFAYGMICALEQEPAATHVLLMDDDVAVSPESIIRTYNLLSLVNDDHAEALLSGAMMNYEIGEDQWEDKGFMTPEGRFAPIKRQLRMTLLNDLVENETYVAPPEAEGNTYAAWWYCAIPTAVIRKVGMPLSVFVRCDDAEYGIRCQRPIMSMNGICIWHLAFHARYNAAVERYQTTRNTMIAQATTGMAPTSDFLEELHGNIQIELKKFNYTNAELLLDGFEDFLKGPEFFSARGQAEESFLRANRKSEKLLSFDELQKQIDALPDFDFDLSELRTYDVYEFIDRSRAQAAVDFLTYNGQRTPFKGRSKGAAIIPSAGWEYPAGKISGKEHLIAIDVFNRKGIIRTVDIDKFNEVEKRYHNDLKAYKACKDQLMQRYAEARPWLTSVEFWKQYLGID